jgi:hypothetical protein
MEQLPVEKLKEYKDAIDMHLQNAFRAAVEMQAIVSDSEGDSDLFRKLSFYLTPNLNHWINGGQAGGMKDIEALLSKRLK